MNPQLPSAHAVPARVLIVDDDPASIQTATSLLTGASNSIRTASSGAEALSIARNWLPDIILLDVMMPGIDGFEVCRRLRADPDIAETRVFFLTALDDSSSRMEGFLSGADDFITKPLNRREALARIQGVARLNRYRALIREHNSIRGVIDRYVMPGSVPVALSSAEIGAALGRALDGLKLAFQPIFSVATGDTPPRIFANEALMRSQEPLLPDPPSVLAAAARLGLLVDVGRRVRVLAAEALRTSPAAGVLFINVTAADLLDDLIFSDDEVLLPYADRVVLEITEREPLEELRDVRSRVSRLRDRGFRFAVDDLGGGYASLNSIVVIEPDFVKIDRLLVRSVEAEVPRQKIISLVVTLCRDLGMVAIAEGAETASESEMLVTLGAELIQGYHFARPGARFSATG